MTDTIKKGLVMLGILSITACAGAQFRTKTVAPGVKPVNRPIAQVSFKKHDQTAGASLWKEANYQEYFRDLRASKIGDLVTVNIVETSKASKKADTKSSRDSSIEAGITNLLGWETKLDKAGVPAAFSNTSMFKTNFKNGFTGSGATSRDESMTASITARVIDVMPDGNLYIKGSREVRVNNETHFIVLSGLIRPSDISPDNTVLSSYIANAKIAYTGSGVVSDKQRPGLLMRVVDFVWPF